VSFERPPVVEVVLSAQFAPETVDMEAYGQFAGEVRRELPVRQRQQVVPSMEEAFDTVPPQRSMEITLEGPTSLPRITFESKDGVQLVQIQHDRLTLNWRRRQHDLSYPRYSTLRKRFNVLLKRLTDALDEVGQAHDVNLCEVTYVNPIEVPGPRAKDRVGTTHPDAARIINRFRRRPRQAFLPEAEDAQLQARWRIPAEEVGGSGAPAGRLHLALVPALKPPEGTPIYLVNLSARVRPESGSVDKALRALDIGHKWVVLGFKDLTTAQMHRHWGLEE
jgi:uncharacterized protein (TIGR04255 family)